ncbi:LANO_0F10638g1_1 [Lachancea nothofagi CBS 11611]|uniref:LANO_0F10638g1_1 n=1 Tax=Lachancea nothofagi CBS 11611 TaxID=1266666 RepID=A0A1G4KAG4_9SACH|nr:LANO_0F10638g1_1 [Lachancea nothofagi CBS 11611]
MSVYVLRIPHHALGEFSNSDKVVITGSFDNWEHTKHVLKYNSSDGSYNVAVPRGEANSITFKFVINDKEWVILPYFETRTDSRGLVNNILRWQDNNEECLDDITISSVKPVDRALYTSLIDTNSAATQSEEVQAPLALGATNRTSHVSPVEHDYIHVSSQDELSSTENLNLTAHYSSDSAENLELSSPYESHPMQGGTPPASQKRLQSLVSVVKRVKMYWSS